MRAVYSIQLGEVNGTKIAPVRELLRNKAGVGTGFKWRYQIECAMKVTSQADCKTKMDAVEVALALENQDLLFKNDDDSNTTNSVISAKTLSGVRCLGLAWDSQAGAQFATWRNFSSTFEWETFLSLGTTITAMTWSSGVVTVTCASPHGLSTGQTTLIYAVTPYAYTGSYPVIVTGSNSFTYALAANPGAYGSGGFSFSSILLTDFSETVTIDNPPSRFVTTEAVNGVPPIQRTTVLYPKSTAVQFGYAVGLTGYPTAPVPLWSGSPPLKNRPFTYQTPVKVGANGYKEYRIEWRYEFESVSALAALPPHIW